MPVNNILLKHLSALDPAMQYIKALQAIRSPKKTGGGPDEKPPSRRILIQADLVFSVIDEKRAGVHGIDA